MRRLKSRMMQLPGSLHYVQIDTNWRSTPWASFDQIVSEVIAHRMANPHLRTVNGWSVDRHVVEEEVERYNVRICEAMKWYHFLEDGPEVPSTERPFPPGQPQSQSPGRNAVVANILAGTQILVDWIESGAEAVPVAQANQRAKVCSECPKNGKGDLLSFFTIPVANAIRMALQKRNEMALKTDFDEQLGICEACGCVNKLKCHVPLNRFLYKMTPEAVAALDPKCWILSERDSH
jgi:hypothetical protein